MANVKISAKGNMYIVFATEAEADNAKNNVGGIRFNEDNKIAFVEVGLIENETNSDKLAALITLLRPAAINYIDVNKMCTETIAPAINKRLRILLGK